MAPVEVNLGPAQRQDLAPPQPGHQAEMEGGSKPVIGGRGQKGSGFVQRPTQPATGARGPGRLVERNGVASQPAPLHRFLQCHGQDLADEAG